MNDIKVKPVADRDGHPFLSRNPEGTTETMKSRPKYTCRDYGQEMRLAGLRHQLNHGDLTAEERQVLEREIEERESEMGMD